MRGVGCARLRRAGAGESGEQRSGDTASPMGLRKLHRAGEAIEAHRECPGDIRRSKCAARVLAALTAARR